MFRQISSVWSRLPGWRGQRNPAGVESRDWLRYPTSREGACQPHDDVKDSGWPIRIGDISRGGMRLVAQRRFEVGTLLKIELTESNSPLLLRVVYVAPRSDHRWTVGCSFPKKLNEEELHSLGASPSAS